MNKRTAKKIQKNKESLQYNKKQMSDSEHVSKKHESKKDKK